jgi:hypothetical protein
MKNQKIQTGRTIIGLVVNDTFIEFLTLLDTNTFKSITNTTTISINIKLLNTINHYKYYENY